MAFDIVIPAVVEPFPCYREEWWVLFHDVLGLANQRLALRLIDLPSDLR
jgi:hypothetical protein